MLMGIQDLLDNPNPKSPAQREAYGTITITTKLHSHAPVTRRSLRSPLSPPLLAEMFLRDRQGYNQKIKEQAARNVPDT